LSWLSLNGAQKKVPNLTIGTYIKGLLEYTPPGYNPVGTTRYPVIIYFHGVGEVGPGSNSSLCNILTLCCGGSDNNIFDIPLPERVERGQVPAVINGGTTYNYIILSPQYSEYTYPTAYPSAPDVEAMIDYAVSHYRIDVNRIYLTGMSSGANMILEYAGSSLARAQRVAAIAMASECSTVGNYPAGPGFVSTANLAVWELHCISDGTCPDSIPTNWINAINAQNPPPIPLAKNNSSCYRLALQRRFYPQYLEHILDPAFTVNGLNVYNWLIQNSRSFTLPVNEELYKRLRRVRDR
jgi:hypothetical protein